MVLGQLFCRFTGSAAQLEHNACARRHGPQLVSKKFLEEEIFVGTNFRELAFHRENRENFCLVKISRYTVFGHFQSASYKEGGGSRVAVHTTHRETN